MDVDASLGRNVDDSLGKNQPIGHDDHQIRSECPESIYRTGLLERFGLKYRNSSCFGHTFDGCRNDLSPPALGSIGLRVGRDDLVT